ncbi:hypothetical protein [Pseudomonas sp. DWP3-1-2]|uniref:hypothetical protein n=1 Tax=Pseudomonas sp. DWP3-1-2 TaxID=2804645 RepID=UPI003CF845D3
MLETEFKALIEERINHAAQRITSSKNAKFDDVAFGKLGFYLSLRRVINGTSSAQDIGLFDAINDTLQALKLLDSDETFLAGVL